MTFFRTTLGIVVGIILAVWIIACLAGGYYHHRYERGWDDDMVRGGYQGYYDGRDQMRAMQEQMYQAQRAMDQRAHQMQQQAQQTPPSSGQKHVSSIQISDGVEAGYTLSVSDDTIQ
ncbi:MAG: hypothetical protein H6766_03855 [Candidatus Peribacteria bacterium]|nr:MAG: hypothetical protein H6766_03855 [Candidatus Peribacteria bacterium]